MANAGDIRAGRAYVELGADSTQLEEKVKGAKNLLGQLKEGFGRGSTFGDVTRILAGGGAIYGLAKGGQLLANMTEEAVKLRDALGAGEKTAGQVTDEFLRTLPVLGEIYAAGRNIHELITGEEGAARAVRVEVERLNKASDARLALQKAILAATEQQAEVMRGLVDRGAQTGLNPEDQSRVQAQQQRDAEIRKRQADAEKLKAGIRAKSEPAVQAEFEQIRSLEKRRDDLRAGPLPGDRAPLIGSGDDRFENAKKLKETQDEIDAHYSKVNGIRKDAADAATAIDAAQRQEEAKAEDVYFREMIDKERAAAEEAAQAVNEKWAKATQEQKAMKVKAAEDAAKQAKEEFDRFVEGYIGTGDTTGAGELAGQAGAATMAKLAEDAKAVIEATRTPTEKFAETVEKLEGLLDSGAIDFETFSRAYKDAADEIHQGFTQAAKEAERRATSAAVTFSGFRPEALGSRSVGDRIAAATEETAKNTRRNAAGVTPLMFQ